MRIFHDANHGLIGALNDVEGPLVADNFVIKDDSLERDCMLAAPVIAGELADVWDARRRALQGLISDHNSATAEQRDAIEKQALRLDREGKLVKNIITTIRSHADRGKHVE